MGHGVNYLTSYQQLRTNTWWYLLMIGLENFYNFGLNYKHEYLPENQNFG